MSGQLISGQLIGVIQILELPRIQKQKEKKERKIENTKKSESKN